MISLIAAALLLQTPAPASDAATLSPAANAPKKAGILPIRLREGMLIKASLCDSLNYLDAEGKPQIRKAAAGHSFVVLEIKMEKSHSIGRSDYMLRQSDGKAQPCLMMAKEMELYNPAAWIFQCLPASPVRLKETDGEKTLLSRPVNEGAVIKLAFETDAVPKSRYSLVSALKPTQIDPASLAPATEFPAEAESAAH
ncbi:MAG: hypothetical protein RL095_121 [Verrucomicrobiota bacterium]|jgi:hypothetical protein